jgi:hypothetical protein
MTGRNANIYFSEQTYQKLRQIAGIKISRFVNEAVEEKLRQVEQQKNEKLHQKLVADYQSVTKSKKAQREAKIWDETLNDAWK